MKLFLSFVSLLLFVAPIPALGGDPPSNGGSPSKDAPSQFFYNKSLGGRADLRGPNDGCFHTSAFVQAFRSTSGSHLEPETTGTGVFVQLSRQNICSNVLELDASGFALVEKFGFEKTAVFALATVRVTDRLSGAQSSVRVKLVWNAVSTRTETASLVKTIQPDGYREESRFNDISTISSAVGSISDGVYEYASQYESATIFRTETKFSIFPVE